MIVIILLIVGLCVGSFINVLVDRIPAGRSVLFGRSSCDFCKKELSAFDLVPIFSYIFLRGTCRYCHKKLSLQYPLVEIITGLSFVALFLIEQPTATQFPLFIIDLCLLSLSIALIGMDMKYHILSDILLLFFALFSFSRFVLVDAAVLVPHLLIGFFSIFPLLLIFLLSKGKGMGFGDVKLIFVLGFLLGFPKILILYYFAFLTGAVVGVILIVVKKKKLHGAQIAFGPFLFLGAGIALLWGNTIWLFAKSFIGL